MVKNNQLIWRSWSDSCFNYKNNDHEKTINDSIRSHLYSIDRL